MEITSSAKIKLCELIEQERIRRNDDSEIGFTLIHVCAAQDSRRTEEGKYEFYVVEEAGWVLKICGAQPIGFKTQPSSKLTASRDFYKPTKLDGLLFYTYSLPVPDNTLDFDGQQFTVDGEPVKSNE